MQLDRVTVLLRRTAMSIALGASTLLAPSCSIFLEASRPGYVDTSKVQKGTTRPEVIEALGKPLYSQTNSGSTVDVYVLDANGRRLITKVGLTTFNLAANVFTFGLWEAVGTPVEHYTEHRLTPYVITYSSNLEVESVETPVPPMGPIMAVTVEERAQVKDVDVFYISVVNLSPDDLRLINVSATSTSGKRINELDLDDAIGRAGGADQLAASMHHLPNVASAATQMPAFYVPGTQANADAGLGLMGPVVALFDPVSAVVGTTVIAGAAVASPESMELRMSCLSVVGKPSNLRVRHVRKGYVFLPVGDYSTIDVTGDGKPPEKDRETYTDKVSGRI
jgi:hypothetical protein